MGFLPKAMGTRPRLACEVRAEGVVAARAEDSAAALSAVERVVFANGISGADGASANGAARLEIIRAEKVSAVRRALDAVSGRGREVTLIVPDMAARVLLIDFDELPAKASEALPVVRFRLKKLLPFDADDAAVSYQVMAQTRSGAQVLAVAIPRASLADYEGIVRDAGYEPGAVLPSTLSALAGLDEDAPPTLVVNAGRESVTTAIVKDGMLLLHRMVDMGGGAATAAIPATDAGNLGAKAAPSNAPMPASMPTTAAPVDEPSRETARDTTIAAIAARFAAMEGQTPAAPRAPDGPQVSRVGSALASGMAAQGASPPGTASAPTATTAVSAAQTFVAPAEEIVQAVNVAAAYFEDTLGMAPQVIFSAGTLGAEALARLLGAGAPRVEEMVSGGANGGVPAGWLASVRGALRS